MQHRSAGNRSGLGRLVGVGWVLGGWVGGVMAFEQQISVFRLGVSRLAQLPPPPKKNGVEVCVPSTQRFTVDGRTFLAWDGSM